MGVNTIICLCLIPQMVPCLATLDAAARGPYADCSARVQLELEHNMLKGSSSNDPLLFALKPQSCWSLVPRSEDVFAQTAAT
jgi:hypothetical protein